MDNLCYYGCGNIAIYKKTKYAKGECCSLRFYDCPGYRKLLKERKSWNKGKTAHTDDRIRLVGEKLKGRIGTFTGNTHSIETKIKISNSMKGNNNGNHRGDRQSYYNNIRMDSKWEIYVAEYFDFNHIKWKYNEKSYIISDGRHYYPDFFIYDEFDNFIKLIEVKGYFRESNKIKFYKFIEEYPDVCIELWDKPILIQLGIINKSGNKELYKKEW